MNTAQTIAIDSLNDPRVALLSNLRERDLRSEGVFVTEGVLLAERLLQSRFPVQLLLMAAESRAQFTAPVPRDVPIYVAPSSLLRQIVGFDFHRGVLAVARRLPFFDVPALIQSLLETVADPSQTLRLLACPDTAVGENLGLIVRSARAFGVHGLLLPDDGADPLSRRCLRQSMGGALALPIARSEDLLGELDAAKNLHGLRLVAAVASSDATALHDFIWPRRTVLVVGNEYHGLDAPWLNACDDLVTIPVAPECDSLNVAVAAGVLLHSLRGA